MLSNSAGASDDTTPALPSTKEAPAAGSPPRQLELQDEPAGTVRRPTGLLDLPDELLTVIWEAVFASYRPQIGTLLLNKRITEAVLPSWWRMLILQGDMTTLDHKLDFVLNRPSARRHIQHLVFSPMNALHPVRLALAAATQLESLTDIVISLVEDSANHPVCRYAEILASLPLLDRLYMMVRGEADVLKPTPIFKALRHFATNHAAFAEWFLDETQPHLSSIIFEQTGDRRFPALPWPRLHQLKELEVHFTSCSHESVDGIWAGLASLRGQAVLSSFHLRSLRIFFDDDPDASSKDGLSLSDFVYQQLLPVLQDARLSDLSVSETSKARWEFLAGLEPLSTVTSLYYDATCDGSSDTDKWRGLARLLPLFPALRKLRLVFFTFCKLADLSPDEFAVQTRIQELAVNHPTLFAVLAYLKCTQVRELRLEADDEENVLRATRYPGEADFRLERCREEDGGQSVHGYW